MPKRIIELSGQCALGPDGEPQAPGDMGGQMRLAIDNIETVLQQGGMDLSNITRIRVFATDVGAAVENWSAVTERLNAVSCRPAATLVGVTGLFSPDLLVEIEATAAE